MKQKDIVLDFYKGAYGPTLRIDVQTFKALTELKKLFLWLSESEEHIINLVELNNIRTTGLNRLILKCIPDNEESDKKLTLTSCAKLGIVFEWTLPSQEWDDVAGLVDGLIENNGPGHQYLTQAGIDDVIVELAFME
jgi:hypothetical protein